MTDPSSPIVLEYRLTEADVRRYGSAGRARKSWACCRDRKAAILVLLGLGGFLVAICQRAHGVRSAAMALGASLVVIAALAWGREARVGGRVLRLARQMGLPREVRLVASADGIAEELGPGSPDPSRTYAWPEVLDVSRGDHLTVFALRPGGGVLMVPDSSFSTAEDRAGFVESVRAWRLEALAISSPEGSARPGSRG